MSHPPPVNTNRGDTITLISEDEDDFAPPFATVKEKGKAKAATAVSEDEDEDINDLLRRHLDADPAAKGSPQDVDQQQQQQQDLNAILQKQQDQIAAVQVCLLSLEEIMNVSSHG